MVNLLDELRPTAAPAEFVRAVVKAFQRSPAAVALEADLTLSLASSFSLRNYLTPQWWRIFYDCRRTRTYAGISQKISSLPP
jgi:hypothetical protein